MQLEPSTTPRTPEITSTETEVTPIDSVVTAALVEGQPQIVSEAEKVLQVILCQKDSLFHQLKPKWWQIVRWIARSVWENYKFSTYFWHSVQIVVHNMYWTCNSMDKQSSYFGLQVQDIKKYKFLDPKSPALYI